MFTAIPVVLSSLGFAATAQDPAAPSDDWLRREGNEIVLEVKGAAAPTLLDLVRACERTTGPRFYLQRGEEEQLTRERLSSIGSTRLPAEQLFGFVQGLLRAHDFGCALVAEQPELVVRAIRLQGEGIMAMRNSTRFIEAHEIPAHAADQAMLFSSFIPLAHVDPQQAAQMLSRSFANNAFEGFSSQSGPTGTKGLFVVGYGPMLNGMANLLRRVDLEPVISDLGVLHCEVWQLDDAALVSRIEELAGREDAGEALEAVRSAPSGAKRLARYQGPASNQIPAQVSSEWSGPEERLSASIELLPSVVEGNVLRVSLSLHVKGDGQQSGVNARISGTSQLARGGVRALLSSSQRGATVAFLSLR